jgi:ABC-2 type transport system ATP-binding protein
MRKRMLEVIDLSVTYGTVKAVDHISFSIDSGEIFGLLGPNGAGKTSALSAVENLITPNTGTLVVSGIDIRKHPLEAKKVMGVQLQSTSFQSELTLKQIIKLYAGLYGG